MSSTRDAARWLEDTVGIGGVFTKEQLRAAFPGVTQIDRRVRDLRARGWVIDTRRQDPSLGQTEMRLVEIGGLDNPRSSISSKERREALLSWAYSCCLCGAHGSSTYPDAKHVRVQLIVRDVPGLPGALVPVCLRCAPSVVELADLEQPLGQSLDGLAVLAEADWRRVCLARLSARIAEMG